jgi:crossover junction endodeoxyribonuclease RusA
VKLVLPYPVSANRYWRSFVPRGHKRALVVVSDEAKAYIREVGLEAKRQGLRKPATGLVSLTVRLIPANRVCMDLDNALKVVIDALRGMTAVPASRSRSTLTCPHRHRSSPMLLQREKSVNFVEIILDLRRHRWRLHAIADAINVHPSTLKKWFYSSACPNFEDGRALVGLYRRVLESFESDKTTSVSSTQYALRAREISLKKDTTMAKRPQVREPGTEALPPDSGAGQSDPDAAIAMGRSGRARKIVKPKPAVPKSRVRGDPERSGEAAVNAVREMSYAGAMAARDARALPRAVLTDRGWVQPLPSEEQIRAAQRSR